MEHPGITYPFELDLGDPEFGDVTENYIMRYPQEYLPTNTSMKDLVMKLDGIDKKGEVNTLDYV